ncbi:MAG TPA: tRNA (N6-isopentenyl adenosine(37)-C2)-methylthiotransferase MiaB, partial [Ureibacillus sp.]|nr:tRNA (N6-isopentenyl adenosine(37)-C2)-methylthiotransferase MiaB [Ureibacillus sp.]
MNEEQRLASQQVNQPKPTNAKPEKDYSQYFERVMTAPSLKDAKKRGKEEVKYHKDFDID